MGRISPLHDFLDEETRSVSMNPLILRLVSINVR